MLKDGQTYFNIMDEHVKMKKSNKVIFSWPQQVRREVVDRRCSVKILFFKTLQNSQENTCAGASF